MKTDKSASKNSNYVPVPITLSVEDHADDLFNDPSEESEFMHGSARGDTEQFCLVMKMILVDVLAAFPLPASHIQSQRVEVSLSQIFVPPVRRGDVVQHQELKFAASDSLSAPFQKRHVLPWIRRNL